MIKKILIFCIALLLTFFFYFQYKYENAIGICEMVGDKKDFFQKLNMAENENNTTLAGILFIYYAHRCSDFTKDEKFFLKSRIYMIRNRDR